MGKRKSWGKMAGDTIREAAVLILVFGFIDTFIQREDLVKLGLNPWWVAGSVPVISLALWLIGAGFERNRPE